MARYGVRTIIALSGLCQRMGRYDFGTMLVSVALAYALYLLSIRIKHGCHIGRLDPGGEAWLGQEYGQCCRLIGGHTI